MFSFTSVPLKETDKTSLKNVCAVGVEMAEPYPFYTYEQWDFIFIIFLKIITLIPFYFVFFQMIFRGRVRVSIWKEIGSEGDKYGRAISIKTAKLFLIISVFTEHSYSIEYYS